MAITSLNSVTSAIAAGQCLKQSWNKTFVATTTVGKWYNTFQLAGQAGVYGGVVLTNAGTNWTATVNNSNIVTIDTITAHGLFVGETFATNASWLVVTWMQSLSAQVITSVPTPHTFTFTKTQGQQVTTTETTAAANISPTLLQATPMIGSAASAVTSYGGAFNPGRICHAENVSSLVKHLLAIEVTAPTAASTPSQLMLVDLLVNYPGISMTSAVTQTMIVNTSPLPRYSSGVGVMAFLEVTTANGTGAQNVTITYCNSSGITGQVTPGTVANTISSVVGHIPYTGIAVNNFGPFLPLASNDQGIQYVTNLTFSGASTTGAAALVLCKPLATIPLAAVSTTTYKDYIFDMLSMPRIYDGACLAFLYYAGVGVATPAVYGILDFVWG